MKSTGNRPGRSLFPSRRNRLCRYGLLAACFASWALAGQREATCAQEADGKRSRQETAGPIKVELKQVDGRFALWREGKPYRIQGAGLEFGDVAKLASHGANSFRTWRTENGRDSGQEVLDRAAQHGLTVMMCLELGVERNGFDYSDPQAVARQFADAKAEVLKYKDHPALLIWAIGNELNLRAENPKVWDAVNEISKMIHQLDSNHPTTTTLAGFNKELVAEIENRASDLDLLCFQLYADLENLPRYLREADYRAPYIISEWGATGHWEVGKTPWEAPVENDSTVKADAYLKRYRNVIEPFSAQCVGSYVFLWGQKQERTPTWYGMFLEAGEETETVDVMHLIWTGKWPANRAPRLNSFRLAEKSAVDGIQVRPGASYAAQVEARDPDGDPLVFAWDVKPESTDLQDGGDFESTPKSIPGLVKPADASSVTLTAPHKPGAYRLFVYVYDGHGHAAHANIPFLVKE